MKIVAVLSIQNRQRCIALVVTSPLVANHKLSRYGRSQLNILVPK